MRTTKYRITYRGLMHEAHRHFSSFQTLYKFLQRIPEWELGSITVSKLNNGLHYLGALVRLKKGGVSVRF